MMPTFANIVSKCLRLPSDALVWEANRLITDHFPGKYILETGDYDFQLAEYARSGRCHLHPVDPDCAQFHAEWFGKEIGAVLEVQNAFLEVLWRGKRLYVLTLTYTVRYEQTRHWIIADSVSDAKDFFSAVCGYRAVAEGDILVFQQGDWSKDKRLMEDIKLSSMDGLVLPAELRDQLVKEVDCFFAGQETYAQMGVSWKRGLLLVGPPGNGKTHAIKALVQHTQKPCLYVRSLKSECSSPQENIERVFHRARQASPCILVFEDLDSLLTKDTLSAFLNAMDGFADNRGILTIATTNHPDRIDIALVERPSRFDRKLSFDLPKATERRRYLHLMDQRRHPDMQIAESDLTAVVEATKGYSFAMLKELHVATTMAWMEERVIGSMGRICLELAKRIYCDAGIRQKKGKKDSKRDRSKDE